MPQVQTCITIITSDIIPDLQTISRDDYRNVNDSDEQV